MTPTPPTDGPSGAVELDAMARLAQAVVDARDAYEDAEGVEAENRALHACESAERIRRALDRMKP